MNRENLPCALSENSLSNGRVKHHNNGGGGGGGGALCTGKNWLSHI